MNFLTYVQLGAVVLLGAALAVACDKGNSDRAFGCGCFKGGADNVGFTAVCDAEQLCPTLNYSTFNDGYADELSVDEEIVSCFIDALIAGEPGVLRAESNDAMGNTSTYIYVNGDVQRTAFMLAKGWQDLQNCSSGMAQHSLAAPSYFEECALISNSFERYECVERGVKQAVVDVCWERACVSDYD